MTSPKIKFKRTDKSTVSVPLRSTDGSAGFDIFSNQRLVLIPGANMLIGAGFHCAIPKEWVGTIHPRSSMAHKHLIRVGARIIDSDYRGEVMINLFNDGEQAYEIEIGDKIAQMVVTPYLGDSEEVENLDDTERGEGGFGSTGK